MTRVWQSLKRGVLTLIVFGVVSSLVSWLWEQVRYYLRLFPEDYRPIAAILAPLLIYIIGYLSETVVPWLSANIQGALTFLLLRRFEESPEGGELKPSSWLFKEVAFAEDGHFKDGQEPEVQSLGVVTAEVPGDPEQIWVLFVYPPTGTGRFVLIRKDSRRVRLTGRTAADYGMTTASLGRNMHSF